MPSAPDFDSSTSAPYAERQLIVVMPNDVVEAARKAEAKAAESADPIDWIDVARVVARVVTGSVFSTLLDLTTDALSAWARARQNGINVLQISRSEAASLTFPPGHPRDGVLYVGHPAIQNVYYTMASFHRMAFEHD